jgi:3-deoxy-D-manno-octulosonic-acid transferase
LDRPDSKIILTFFSPSGYEIWKNYDLAEAVFYMPFDTRKHAEKFIELIKPEMAIFVKYEFWYHFLRELDKRNISTYLVSAIFRNEQPFFKSYGNLHRSMLRCFNKIFVQNDESKKLLAEIDIGNVTVAGDTRFDRVSIIPKNAKPIPLAKLFSANRKVIVIGSSWREDIELFSNMSLADSPDMTFIIAPHEISERNLKHIESKMKGSVVRYSNANEDEIGSKDRLIIDNIGMLSDLYQYAYFAYVGGSFGDGLHNILEPATYGIPVIFGKSKSNAKYQEAVEMVDVGAGFEVRDSVELGRIVNRLLADEGFYRAAAGKARTYIDNNTGATNKISDELIQALK